MSDLVERLREVAERPDANYPAIMEQAAARIEQLEAALRPLACKCSVKGMGAGGNCTRGTGECDCWNARAALEDKCTFS